MKKYLFLTIILIKLISLTSCSDLNSNYSTLDTINYQPYIVSHEMVYEITALIERFVESANNNDIYDILSILYFTERDKLTGHKDVYLNALLNFDPGTHKLMDIIKINDNILLSKGTIYTFTEEGEVYRTSHFNPFVCIIDGELRLVMLRRQIPSELYNDTYVPDNYDSDDPDIITHEIIFLP